MHSSRSASVTNICHPQNKKKTQNEQIDEIIRKYTEMSCINNAAQLKWVKSTKRTFDERTERRQTVSKRKVRRKRQQRPAATIESSSWKSKNAVKIDVI